MDLVKRHKTLHSRVKYFVRMSSLNTWNMQYLNVISFIVCNSKVYFYMAFIIVLFALLASLSISNTFHIYVGSGYICTLKMNTGAECTNPRYLVAQVTKLCMAAPNIFSIIIAVSFFLHTKLFYHFTNTTQKAPENCEIHTSVQNCGSSVWTLLHVTFLVSRI